MNRRELLRVLAAAGAVPLLGGLSPRDLVAAARVLEARGLRAGAAAFRTLTSHEGATVTAIAEAIIPETDTPGATAVGVPQFIDLIVGEWYDDDDRAAFLAGLAEVDARSRDATGVAFIDSDADAQTRLLEALDTEALHPREPDAPEPFFTTIKRLTLWGYYTSEAGATQELRWQVVPGRFDGCVELPPRTGGERAI